MKRLPLVFVLVLASGPLVSGHHSFAAHYFEEQSVTVQGTLVEFEYSAPHAWVTPVGHRRQRSGERYSAEWSNPNRLSRDGISKDTLKAGDYVILSGSPGRNAGENRIHLKRIERPADGWKWAAARR